MALVLRTISKPKWAARDGMEPGAAPADAVGDLRTTDNELSVWRVETDQSNLNAVLAAFASNRDRLDKLDYALVQEKVLIGMSQQIPESANSLRGAMCRYFCSASMPSTPPAAPIQWAQADANTPYLAANPAHHNLVDLTARKLARLADAIMLVAHVRLSEKEVKQLLRDALNEGALDRGRVKPGLMKEIDVA
jgi:hypothetical protein